MRGRDLLATLGPPRSITPQLTFFSSKSFGGVPLSGTRVGPAVLCCVESLTQAPERVGFLLLVLTFQSCGLRAVLGAKQSVAAPGCRGLAPRAQGQRPAPEGTLRGGWVPQGACEGSRQGSMMPGHRPTSWDRTGGGSVSWEGSWGLPGPEECGEVRRGQQVKEAGGFVASGWGRGEGRLEEGTWVVP